MLSHARNVWLSLLLVIVDTTRVALPQLTLSQGLCMNHKMSLVPISAASILRATVLASPSRRRSCARDPLIVRTTEGQWRSNTRSQRVRLRLFPSSPKSSGKLCTHLLHLLPNTYSR